MHLTSLDRFISRSTLIILWVGSFSSTQSTQHWQDVSQTKVVVNLHIFSWEKILQFMESLLCTEILDTNYTMRSNYWSCWYQNQISHTALVALVIKSATTWLSFQIEQNNLCWKSLEIRLKTTRHQFSPFHQVNGKHLVITQVTKAYLISTSLLR